MPTKSAQHARHGTQQYRSPTIGNCRIAAALFLLTLLLYLPTIRNEFIDFDDGEYITANAHVLAGLTNADFKWALATISPYYWHPLTWISHQLDCELWGDTPAWPHLVNDLLHATSAGLLFLFLVCATGCRWPSAVGAALFAWHPLRVESVAWAAERKDVLSTCFFLLTLICYLRYTRGSQLRWYVLAIIGFVLSLMSKPTAATLPFLLILLDWWPLGRLSEPNKRLVRLVLLEKLPFLVLTVASSIVTYCGQRAGGAVAVAEGRYGLKDSLANAVISYVRYLGKIFLPVDLAVFYPLPAHWADWKVVCAVLLLVALTSVCVWNARERRYLATGWLWFLGAFAPMIGLVQVGDQALADRHSYIPSIGITIILCWTCEELVRRHRSMRLPITFAAGIALALLAWMTVHQIGYWRNDFTLFTHAAEVTENNWVADGHIAVGLEKQGRFTEAAALLRSALLIHPKNPAAKDELGNILVRNGRDDEAAALFAGAIEDQPSYLLPHYSLGNVLLRKRRFSEAAQHYRLYLAGNPDDLKAINNLAIALLNTNDLAGAQMEFEKCVELDPVSADAQCSLGRVLIMRGDLADAATHYQRALTLDPQSLKAHNGLADIQTLMQQRQ